MNTIQSSIQHLTADNFDNVLKESDLPVLVDFWAPWCGPCKMMEPVLENFAAEQAGHVVVTKVNVDEAPALAARYEIRSIPTMIFFKDGQEVERTSGAVGKDVLTQKLNSLT